MFEMKDEYRLGIALIDDKHEKLFEIGESAYQILKERNTIDKYDKIMGLLAELKEYTVLHFNEEEDYMKSINYKGIFSQKIAHAEFIKKLSEVNLNKMDQNQDEYLMNIMNFLSTWLTEHIIETDLLIVSK